MADGGNSNVWSAVCAFFVLVGSFLSGFMPWYLKRLDRRTVSKDRRKLSGHPHDDGRGMGHPHKPNHSGDKTAHSD